METEEQILYQLLEVIRGSQINNDEPIDEREVRAYMRTHRANVIRQASKDGVLISENEFQSLGIISLTSGTNYFEYEELPRVLRLSDNFGIKITTASGYNVPVLSREDFELSLKMPFSKVRPKAYFDNSKLYVYQGLSNADMMNSGTGLDNVITEIGTNLNVFLECIAYNPDDIATYDWTSDPYPLSGELISLLKDQLLRKEFSIIVQAKPDEVTNAKHDNIRYHDQTKID